MQMEVDTIEHQLSEVNEENSRLKKELNAVRRQLQHVTQVSQSLIAARAEMQATAAAAATSEGQAKTEKKEKASRKKKRKKDDTTIAKNNTVGKPAAKNNTAGKPAALSAANSSVAMNPLTDTDTDDLVQTGKGLVDAEIDAQTESKSESKPTTNAEIVDSIDQSTAKLMEVEVVQVVTEMVGTVVQAGTKDAHHAARSLTSASISQEPQQSAKATAPKTREDDSMGRHERAEVERNYVGNENVLEKLRKSDFESKVHHDCNELRSEVRHNYNEAHMADAAGHTHLSGKHKHSETTDVLALKARLRALAPSAAAADVPSAAPMQPCCHDTPITVHSRVVQDEVSAADEEQTVTVSQGWKPSTTTMPVRAAPSSEEEDGTATVCVGTANDAALLKTSVADHENTVEKKSDAQQEQTAEQSSGLSVTDQLKNRLQRLKKASAANANSSRSGATNAINQASAPAPRPAPAATEKSQQVAISEPGEGQSKENQPPTPARSSRKRRTTGKADEVCETIESLFLEHSVYAQMHSMNLTIRCTQNEERFEALEQAAAADMGSNRRLTRSAMRQRV
eukprot:COSAG02_NODE_384_length_23406_cov_9.459733_9_plen_568_part_00